MKRLPTGRQNFKEIITQDLVYVDKTRQVYDMVSNGSLYFFPRPRRFGKSLLVSILRYLFSGEKELFKDLYIGRETDYDWTPHPVLQFNFSAYGHKVEHLEEALTEQLGQYAKEYDIEISTSSLSSRFQSLVERISLKDRPVVVLVDEYDKPIVDFLTEPDKAKKNQDVLRDFFSPLKDLDAQGHLKFLFITGVSKFSKVSLFSDLNNLTDLTIHALSHDLLGITQDELLLYFDEHIKNAASKLEMDVEQLLYGIKLWYNGYSWDAETRLYNPFSLLSFFGANDFGNFWFATGTPTFLVNSIRDRGIDPQELEDKEVSYSFFDKFTLEGLDMVGLLFQTGYLTIKNKRRRGFETNYFLGYPNTEVSKSLYHNLLEAFTFKPNSTVGNSLLKMQRGLEEGNIQLFVDHLKILLSDISYHLLPKKKNSQTEFGAWEGYFHTIVYLITSFMGLYVQSEITKHKGRLDLLAEADDFIYLMEFKLGGQAAAAIQQIKDMEYAASLKGSKKTAYLVGINFSKEERNVSGWEAEVL